MKSLAFPGPTILMIGVGDLTSRLAHILATSAPAARLLIASRSIERATRYANLTKLAAFNLGMVCEVNALELDLSNIDRTTAQLSQLQPDLVFMGASIQAARTIMDLPPDLFRKIDEAQLGPWLPMHLTLNYELMQAVRASGVQATVVNGAYPDAVGPVLATVGLNPHIGIGNIGNVVPGITHAAALVSGAAPTDLTIELVAHHYFSHHVHRFGESDGIPHILNVRDGAGLVDVDSVKLYALLASDLRRQGGKEGQQLTATSAARVLLGLLGDDPVRTHAPAPNGLVGGYPVTLTRESITVDLATEVELARAQVVNEACQVLDGIEAIGHDGSLVFTDRRMAVMEELLGYRVKALALQDMRGAAEELTERYEKLLSRHGLT